MHTIPVEHWNGDPDAGGDSGASDGQGVQEPESVAPDSAWYVLAGQG